MGAWSSAPSFSTITSKPKRLNPDRQAGVAKDGKTKAPQRGLAGLRDIGSEFPTTRERLTVPKPPYQKAEPPGKGTGWVQLAGGG